MVKTSVITSQLIEGPNSILCIPLILNGSPNECWLHKYDACVIITTRRLGLRAPLVPPIIIIIIIIIIIKCNNRNYKKNSFGYHGNVTFMTNVNDMCIILLGITMLPDSHLKLETFYP